MTPPNSSPDAAAAPARDQRSEWVGHHQDYLWRFLRYLGADRELAEDLTQETFLAALAAGVDRWEPGPGAAWLRTTARNLFRMQLRRARRRGPTLPLEEWAAVFTRCMAAEIEPVGGPSYLDALDQCLLGLDDRERRALQLRYGEGASREAIAGELDLSAEGAKTLLRRTKARLRQCIERRRDHGPTT